MDISESINKKAEDLRQIASQLSKINIKWEKPIRLICNQIESYNYKDIHSHLVEYRKEPAIYFFKIICQNSGNDIVQSLSQFKTHKLRTCSQIDKKRVQSSSFLYCGSVKKELHGRLVQHLGFGSSQTGSLQLTHWAKDLNLHLEFHYAWLGQENIKYTTYVESALANQIRPLVGRYA